MHTCTRTTSLKTTFDGKILRFGRQILAILLASLQNTSAHLPVMLSKAQPTLENCIERAYFTVKGLQNEQNFSNKTKKSEQKFTILSYKNTNRHLGLMPQMPVLVIFGDNYSATGA